MQLSNIVSHWMLAVYTRLIRSAASALHPAKKQPLSGPNINLMYHKMCKLHIVLYLLPIPKEPTTLHMTLHSF